MKKLFASAIVIASMLALLTGCNEEKQPQKPAPQFGVVQLTKLYQDTRISKAGFTRLTELEAKAQAMMKAAVAEYEKVRTQDDAAAARMEKDIQDQATYIQDIMRQEQEHVVNVIQTVFKKEFEKYSKEHGLFGIFNAEEMLSSSPEADVTAQLSKIIDTIEPSFGDLPSLELPKRPEPANAVPAEPVAPAEPAAPAEQAPEAK